MSRDRRYEVAAEGMPDEIEDLTPAEFLEAWRAMCQADKQRMLAEASLGVLIEARNLVEDELRARMH